MEFVRIVVLLLLVWRNVVVAKDAEEHHADSRVRIQDLRKMLQDSGNSNQQEQEWSQESSWNPDGQQDDFSSDQAATESEANFQGDGTGNWQADAGQDDQAFQGSEQTADGFQGDSSQAVSVSTEGDGNADVTSQSETSVEIQDDVSWETSSEGQVTDHGSDGGGANQNDESYSGVDGTTTGEGFSEGGDGSFESTENAGSNDESFDQNFDGNGEDSTQNAGSNEQSFDQNFDGNGEDSNQIPENQEDFYQDETQPQDGTSPPLDKWNQDQSAGEEASQSMEWLKDTLTLLTDDPSGESTTTTTTTDTSQNPTPTSTDSSSAQQGTTDDYYANRFRAHRESGVTELDIDKESFSPTPTTTLTITGREDSPPSEQGNRPMAVFG